MADQEKSEGRALSADEAQSIAEAKQSTDSREGAPSLLLDSSIIRSSRLDWELVAWAAILILAVITRFYELGARGMSHDESLHAVYSHELYRSGSYQHNPMMHGPFLFHANALIYYLFGVSDATSRVMPALAGIGAIGMAWFYRRWLGRLGALFAGLMLLVSPSLLFHSRYIRNDIYIVLIAMIWVYGIFRFVEERRLKWLYLTVAAMALGFATKENQFMSGADFRRLPGRSGPLAPFSRARAGPPQPLWRSCSSLPYPRPAIHRPVWSPAIGLGCTRLLDHRGLGQIGALRPSDDRCQRDDRDVLVHRAEEQQQGQRGRCN